MITRGIGIDLIHVPRVRKLVERWGRAGLTRLFHPEEVEYAMGTRRPCRHLAGRFAAKEALVKAMGGMPPGARFRDVRVGREPSGRPVLILDGAWAEHALKMGVSAVDVTISHGGDYAVAGVVLAGPGER